MPSLPLAAAPSTAPAPRQPSPSVAESVLRQFVDSALNEADSNNKGRVYQQLHSQLSLSHAAKDAGACQRWFTALLPHAARIGANTERYTDLMAFIWKFDFYHYYDSDCAKTYCDLIVAIVSTAAFNPAILTVALRTFIRAFLHSGRDDDEDEKKNGSDTNNSTGAESKVDHDRKMLAKETSMALVHDLCHTAIARLIRLSPSSLSIMSNLLDYNFPHTRLSSLTWLAYVKNLLRFSEYLGSLREKILTLIIERLILVDVECGGEQSQLANERQSNNEHADANINAGSDSESESQSSMTMFLSSVIQSQHAQKLDNVLRLVFEYLTLIAPPATYTLTTLNQDTFACLLRVFDRSIVPTHSIHCIQFVMFYYCSLRQQFTESYLQWLLDRIKDDQSSQQSRIASVSYLASFLARASYIRSESVLNFFEQLLLFTVELVDDTQSRRRLELNLDDSVLVSDFEAKNYSLFYRCVQCLLYIVTFRCQLFDERLSDNYELLQTLKIYFQDLLDNSLQPLHFCDSLIVKQFQLAANTLELCDVQHILVMQLKKKKLSGGDRPVRPGAKDSEWNLWKLSQSHSSLNNGAGLLGFSSSLRDITNEEVFDVSDFTFPFDPWILPLSGQLIERCYNFYQPTARHRQKDSLTSPNTSSSRRVNEKKRKHRSPVISAESPALSHSDSDDDDGGADTENNDYEHDLSSALILTSSPGFGPMASMKSKHRVSAHPVRSSMSTIAMLSSPMLNVSDASLLESGSESDQWTPIALPTVAHLTNSVEAMSMRGNSSDTDSFALLPPAAAVVSSTSANGAIHRDHRSVFTPSSISGNRSGAVMDTLITQGR